LWGRKIKKKERKRNNDRNLEKRKCFHRERKKRKKDQM
jgi:hypothetical protein